MKRLLKRRRVLRTEDFLCSSATCSRLNSASVGGYRKFSRLNRTFSSGNTDTLDEGLMDKILEHSQLRATPVSLQEMWDYGDDLTPKRLLTFSRFIWKELPIRISHRVVELLHLPYGLGSTISVTNLRNLYINQFIACREFPEPRTPADDEAFCELLNNHLVMMGNALPLMALGIQEMLNDHSPFAQELSESPFLNDFLDTFFSSRIGTRVLTGQYVALHKKNPKGWVGQIDGACSPKEITQSAYEEAKELCEREYGRVPGIEILDPSNVSFRYIPTHMRHMCFELLKNSMRAVCETSDESIDEDDLPLIKVVIVDGENEVTLKIADEGGGIPRDDLQKVWLYAFTTVKNTPDLVHDVVGLRGAPFSGFGYGLPISRLYARYFGGDLQLVSMDGHGTDVFLYISKLGENMSDEFLYYPFDTALRRKLDPISKDVQDRVW